jgi:hypothetical protein
VVLWDYLALVLRPILSPSLSLPGRAIIIITSFLSLSLPPPFFFVSLEPMICQPKLYLPQQQHGTRLFRYFFSFSFFFWDL